jgi:glutamine cyclotransferase
VRIDPVTGEVLGGVDLSHLPLPEDRWPGQDVLNGIAVDTETGDIWVTGKLWKALYRIEWPIADR